MATPRRGFPVTATTAPGPADCCHSPTVLFGLPPATVHTSAAPPTAPRPASTASPGRSRRGAGQHSAPGEIEQLRHQLDAMKERLDSMFQTTVRPDRIQRRGRHAGPDRRPRGDRGPRPAHLLAVRMTPDGPVHCHHKGFSADEVPSHIERLLAARPAESPDSWLVVPVRSNRRDYGRLLATSDEGAVLPSGARAAGGLRPLRRECPGRRHRAVGGRGRNAQSSALLELARALATAGTSAEIARRLADAVPRWSIAIGSPCTSGTRCSASWAAGDRSRPSTRTAASARPLRNMVPDAGRGAGVPAQRPRSGAAVHRRGR